MNRWYQIEDLQGFLDQITKISYDKFKEVNDSLDGELEHQIKKNIASSEDILSKTEAEGIVMDLLEKNDEGDYIMCDKILYKIIENLNSRMISNSLCKLVSKGVVESAFDEKLNDFVFWLK